MRISLLNPIKWKKSALIAVLVAIVVVYFTFFHTYSLKTRWDLHQKKKALIERTEKLDQLSEELIEKIDLLSDDEKLLEKIAREEYGMRKPGETVYKIRRK